jgi:hypothetical protein
MEVLDGEEFSDVAPTSVVKIMTWGIPLLIIITLVLIGLVQIP